MLTIASQNAVQPDNIGAGVLVDISATIKNNGTYKAENFTVAFYQGNPSEVGMRIGSRFIEVLVAGATSPAQTVIWNTAGLVPGD